MADSDQPEQGSAPVDGVDDETFARAVGLTSGDDGRRRARKKKKFRNDEIEAPLQSERRNRDRTVVDDPRFVNENAVQLMKTQR